MVVKLSQNSVCAQQCPGRQQSCVPGVHAGRTHAICLLLQASTASALWIMVVVWLRHAPRATTVQVVTRICGFRTGLVRRESMSAERPK